MGSPDAARPRRRRQDARPPRRRRGCRRWSDALYALRRLTVFLKGRRKMDIRWIAIAAALPLAACSSSEAPPESAPPPPAAEMTCQADAVQSYVGQPVTPDPGAATLKASGARTLRWGPPRSQMTMDYRLDRVTVMYAHASQHT